MFEVIYYSLCGSTRKIAEVIALELGIRAKAVGAKKGLAKDAFVFLGSGCYGGKPGLKMLEFIAKNDFKGRQVALFGTSWGDRGDEVEAMQRVLKSMRAVIKGSFHCRGRTFFFFNRGRPSREEVASARMFANEMKKA